MGEWNGRKFHQNGVKRVKDALFKDIIKKNVRHSRLVRLYTIYTPVNIYYSIWVYKYWNHVNTGVLATTTLQSLTPTPAMYKCICVSR